MTVTYSNDDAVQARLALSASDFKNRKEDGQLEAFRIAAKREIELEYGKVGSMAPAPGSWSPPALEDILADIEADIAAAEFRENKLELTQDARPEKDKSWIWKKRAIRKLTTLLRIRHGAAMVTKTKEDE